MARRTGSISIFAAILALVLALAAPAALAHHKDDHTKGGGSKPAATGSDHDGDADSDSGTAYTEDNDTNDDNTPNNVSDDGDNAHPSGKDKSVENGNSGNQGNSESNPDDSKGPMRYEGEIGADKPNGPGGTDLADQDGNNGCGNDDDFDDDNNGWCGKPTEVKADNVKTCPAGTVMGATGKCDEVLGGSTTTPPAPCDKDNNMANGIQSCDKTDVLPGLEESPVAPEDNVLGVRFTAAPAVAAAAVAPAAVAPAAVAPAPAAQGAVLPFTGASDLLPLVALGMLMVAAGALALRGRRSN